MNKKLEEEAAQFTSKRAATPKADTVALRFYAGSIVSGLLSNPSYRPQEALEQAFHMALEMMRLEKEAVK